MLEHVLMLESLHHACGCLLIPNFSTFQVLPEHQSVVEHYSTDEEITAEHYMAGKGLETFRGANDWPRKMTGNYEQCRTWDGPRINLYLDACSVVSISSAYALCSLQAAVQEGEWLPWGKPASHLLFLLLCLQYLPGSDPALALEVVCSVVSNSSSCLLQKHTANPSFCSVLWGRIPKQELRHTHTPTNAAECQNKSGNK